MRAIVFANGTMHTWPEGLSVANENDLIIAADGGLRHCRRWRLVPRMVVGDMDSVDPEALASLDADRTAIIKHPNRKDETDLELAIRLAVANGAEEIIILGALGARWDMTLANVLLMAADDFDAATLRILDGSCELRCLKGRAALTLKGRTGDMVSLLPLAGDAVGVTLEGLEYPLTDARLPMGCSQGVSNVVVGETARVALKSGILLVTITRRR
jgi:thiamine pyrophosphokinase